MLWELCAHILDCAYDKDGWAQGKRKACLTQNTRLRRFAIRVNRTYNRTNRGLIRVTLGPIECIRESLYYL